nr:1828_t:CDS:2 [Entrophospora candida]
MEEGWATELEKREQLPGETVNTFAAHIYELFRRIEHGENNYPERDAIERAKAYEMTYSRGGTLSAYSAEQFMPNIPGMNPGINRSLQGLIDQLVNLIRQ